MRKFTILISVLLVCLSCQNSGLKKINEPVSDGIHQIVVKEKLEANAYTYVKGSEGSDEIWIAIPKTEIKVGGTYYYKGGMLMEKFESKDLKRTFDKVLFLENLSDTREILAEKKSPSQNSINKHVNVNAMDRKKLDISIKPASGAISIAQLFAKKADYAGKSVKITGQVVKYSPEIMKKNWIHLQDGTDNSGSFDLTVSSMEKVSVGDVISVEGKISLNKDFGYGYFYDVILEDAILVK